MNVFVSKFYVSEYCKMEKPLNDHLGDALWRAGYKNEAVFQWKRALLYKPEEDLRENIKFKLNKGL